MLGEALPGVMEVEEAVEETAPLFPPNPYTIVGRVAISPTTPPFCVSIPPRDTNVMRQSEPQVMAPKGTNLRMNEF